MQMVSSHIAEIESNLETIQNDPLNCASAFYFMFANKRGQHQDSSHVFNRSPEVGRQKRKNQQYRGFLTRNAAWLMNI